MTDYSLIYPELFKLFINEEIDEAINYALDCNIIFDKLPFKSQKARCLEARNYLQTDDMIDDSEGFENKGFGVSMDD